MKIKLITVLMVLTTIYSKAQNFKNDNNEQLENLFNKDNIFNAVQYYDTTIITEIQKVQNSDIKIYPNPVKNILYINVRNLSEACYFVNINSNNKIFTF